MVLIEIISVHFYASITVLSVSREDGLAKVAVPEGFDTEKLKAPIEDEGYQVVNIE